MTRKIHCLLDGTIIVTGIPSRTQYIFDVGNQYEIPIGDKPEQIKEEDVADLLSKRRQYRVCCMGADPDLRIFEELNN